MRIIIVRRARPRASAFTLVEVMVVIGIITILVALVLPALRGVKERGRATVCLNNLRQIGSAAINYAALYHDHIPLSSHTAGSIFSPAGWLESLQPFGIKPETRFCPSDALSEGKLTSYATNDYLEPLTPGIDFNPITHQPLPGGRTRALTHFAQIPNPCRTAYIVEPAGGGTIDHIHAVGWTSPAQVEPAIAVRRHLDAANYLFIDGHAAPVLWSYIDSHFSAQNNMFDPETAH